MIKPEEKPTLSVIVPVYNVEPYLRACVDSILAQTFRDFELILVDDGSTDGCPALCDAYEGQDPRVRVIHKENGGLSSARNAGMRSARAELLSFIDSDDFVHPQMFQTLVSPLLVDACIGISMCTYQRCVGEDECDLRMKKLSEPEVIDAVRALEMVYADVVPNITFVAWNKVYRRELFERAGVEYPEGKLYEDGFTTYRLLYEADKAAIVDASLYFYRVRPGSIVSGKKNVDVRRMDELEADLEAWNFFRDKEKGLRIASTKTVLRTCVSIWVDAGDEGYGPIAKNKALSVYKTIWAKGSATLFHEPVKWAAYGLFPFIPRIISRFFLRQ